jgi:hypothetical protein
VGSVRLRRRQDEQAASSSKLELVTVPELPLRHDLPVDPRQVRGSEIDHEEGGSTSLDARVGPGHERLVDPDVGLRIAADDRGGPRDRELLPRPVGPLPDQDGARSRVQGPLRRAARGATAGPSLLRRVASLKAAAAR